MQPESAHKNNSKKKKNNNLWIHCMWLQTNPHAICIFSLGSWLQHRAQALMCVTDNYPGV